MWNWTLPCGAKWAWDPPTLTLGSITSTYLTDDPEAKRFVGKVWRILQKMSTNRFKVELPHIGYVIGGGATDCWAGHDAVRWCSESPTRMIDGKFRPASDWKFPDMLWYRAVEDVER